MPAKTKTGARTKAKSKPGRRKTRTPGLNLVTVAPSLTVSDAHRSLAWYCDVLGFRVKDRWERDGALLGGEIRAGRVSLYIGQDDWKLGRDRIKGQGVRIYFETSQNVDTLAAAIKRRGGTLASEPRDEYGTRSFNLEDPDGYKITIASSR